MVARRPVTASNAAAHAAAAVGLALPAAAIRLAVAAAAVRAAVTAAPIRVALASTAALATPRSLRTDLGNSVLERALLQLP